MVNPSKKDGEVIFCSHLISNDIYLPFQYFLTDQRFGMNRWDMKFQRDPNVHTWDQLPLLSSSVGSSCQFWNEIADAGMSKRQSVTPRTFFSSLLFALSNCSHVIIRIYSVLVNIKISLNDIFNAKKFSSVC